MVHTYLYGIHLILITMCTEAVEISQLWIIIHHWDSIKEGNNLLQKKVDHRKDSIKNLNLDILTTVLLT